MTPIVTRWLPAMAASLAFLAGVNEACAGLNPNWEESGVASWYGPRFDGRRTSTGSRFDPDALTAAHDTLPIGTRLQVTMQETGRSVVVVVNDRMPPKHIRIIDLSRGAAKQLGLLGRGTGMVTLTEASADAISKSAPVEVAEAPDPDPTVSPLRHGQRRTHHAARRASARR